MSGKKIKILLFDDNKNIRESISLLLETEGGFDIVGVHADCNNCVEVVRRCQPDIILMDIQMPGINGIEAVKLIKASFPNTSILMQTVFEDDDKVFASILAGASGYILKTSINNKLTDALYEIQYGGAPMSPSIARKVLAYLQTDTRKNLQQTQIDYNLTNREKEVLSLVVNGLSYKMVGDKLNISYDTVRSHIKKIYEKLHVASLTEAVAKAINDRLV